MPAPNTIEKLMGYVDRRGPDECWPWSFGGSARVARSILGEVA